MIFLLLGVGAKFYLHPPTPQPPLSKAVKILPFNGTGGQKSGAQRHPGHAKAAHQSKAKKEPRKSSQIRNLDSASVEELSKIPHLGPNLARAIVDYREMNGPFREKTDLLRVKEVSVSVYKKIAPYLIVP